MDTKPPLFTVRRVSLVIMSLAIGAVVFFRASQEKVLPNLESLADRHISLFVRVVGAQLIYSKNLPESDRRELLKSINEQWKNLELQYKNNERILIQKAILNQYAGESFENVKSESPLGRDFVELHTLGKIVPDSSPLFLLSTRDFSRLVLYDNLGEVEKKKSLMEKIEYESIIVNAILILLVLGIVGIIFGSITIVSLFLIRRPPVIYHETIQRLGPETQATILESAIVFLFLVFPVGLFITSFFPDVTEIMQMTYMPLCFLLVLFFLSRSIGQEHFRSLFYTPGKTKPFTEVILGVVGFIGIFPMAVLFMLLTTGVFSEHVDPYKQAHPIVFELENRWLSMGILAIIYAPISEEIIFRCLFFGAFRSRFRFRYAAFLSALIFALLHPQGWIALPYLIALGMGLCVLREYTSSVVAPIVMHMCVNTLALSITYLVLYA